VPDKQPLLGNGYTTRNDAVTVRTVFSTLRAEAPVRASGSSVPAGRRVGYRSDVADSLRGHELCQPLPSSTLQRVVGNISVCAVRIATV
jgi:hypothetical protein